MRANRRITDATGQVIELCEFVVASGQELASGERRRFVRVTNASPSMDGTCRGSREILRRQRR